MNCPPHRPSTGISEGPRAGDPSGRAASRYCPRRRGSSPMATPARATQLHHHDFDARTYSPQENHSTRSKRSCARAVDTLFFLFRDDVGSKRGTSSQPADGTSTAGAFSQRHSTCQCNAWRPACVWRSRWRVSFAATFLYLERIGAPRHERRDAGC